MAAARAAEGEPDAARGDVEEEERERGEENGDAQRLAGLAVVGARIERLAGVADHAPAAGGRRGGKLGRGLGR